MEKNKKVKGMSFRMAFLSVGIVPVLIGIIAIAVTLTMSIVSEVKEGIRNELKVAANQLNAYFQYDIEANGVVDYDEYSDHVYVESLKDKDIELTLFKDNSRFLTSIKNENGEYNENTAAAENIYNTVKAGNSYSGENVKIANKNYFVYYEPIYDGDGNFWGMAFAGEPETKLTNAVKSVVIKSVAISGGLLVIFVAIITALGIMLSKTLTITNNGLNKLADGDLSVEFNGHSVVTDFELLIESGRLLQNKLQDSIGKTKDTALKLTDAVAKVDELSETSSIGAQQITQAIDELATTAQSMAETVQDANITVGEIGDSIDRISERLSEMNKSSDTSIEANKVAMEYMDKLVAASNKSSKTVDDISTKISECSEAAANIKTATDAITEIASRTNLLSLNASIEAARAGEAGSGFAVVADEIQKLAEQSSGSAIEIQHVIEEILAKVNDCVIKAKEMNEVISEQMEFLNDAKRKMDDVRTAGDELASGADKINEEAQALVKLKDSVLSNVSDLSAISEENAASSEEVSASIENIAGAVESTRNESGTMKTLAVELDEKMEYFKVD